MRVVSFLPSATETLYLLGAGRNLVGVTHECDYPKQARYKPRLVQVAFDVKGLDSAAIDSKIGELLRSDRDIFKVDIAALSDAQPDLVIAQSICEVCSPFAKVVAQAVHKLGQRPQILILDPHSFDDVIQNIRQIAVAVNRAKEAREVIKSLGSRIARIRRNAPRSKPRVACLEWLNPLFTAGHWVPQMVELAGGINGLSRTGDRSRRTTVAEIAQFDPDKIILMPCGFGLERTIHEAAVFEKIEGWNSLRAVRDGEVYAVDANSYFSKPGPRTVTGLEILAKIIRGETGEKIRVPRLAYRKLVRK
ncbi:MAG: cobalamin-binding protein [Nitrososphaera sp.]